MKALGPFLKDARLQMNLKLREASAATNIDTALISKYEHGERVPSEKHLAFFTDGYHLDAKEIRELWLAEKVSNLIQYEPNAQSILHLAETRMEYLKSAKTFELEELTEELKIQLKRIDTLKEKWKAAKPLNDLQLSKMREYFTTEYVYESNRIEGNTLTLQETHLVINEGLTIGGKSMTEHLEAINHLDAVDFLYELVQTSAQVTKRNLLDVHRLILKGIDRENAGSYRKVPVRISGSKHTPPEPYLVASLMEDYFKHYLKQQHTLHPVILAAEMHERLVSIHPFVDGNGRTSRLVMNLILLNNGYTVANLKGDLDSRMAYYKALESVQVDNNPNAFYQMVANAVEESLLEHLKLV